MYVNVNVVPKDWLSLFQAQILEKECMYNTSKLLQKRQVIDICKLEIVHSWHYTGCKISCLFNDCQ